MIPSVIIRGRAQTGWPSHHESAEKRLSFRRSGPTRRRVQRTTTLHEVEALRRKKEPAELVVVQECLLAVRTMKRELESCTPIPDQSTPTVQ